MNSSTTALYAALLVVVYIVLSVRIIRLRRRLRVAIGNGDQPLLTRATRAHGNFAEYVPLSLLMIHFLEIQTGNGWWIHALGMALLVGRISHAYGVSQVEENLRFRVTGMSLTFSTLSLAALGVLLSH